MPSEFTQALRDWQSFFLLAGTAAATLTGLMFIAITLSSRFITRTSAPHVRVWLDPTLFQFGGVLVTALVFLIPNATVFSVGVFLTVAGVLTLMGWVRTLRRMLRQQSIQPLDALDWFWYRGLPLLSTLLVFAAGIGFLRGTVGAITLAGIGCLLLLVASLVNAWDVVLESVQFDPQDMERYKAELQRGP